ncbi:maltose permease MAL31 [Cladophialophora carrionii]|uniref:Maltose permease MAL31 n=1 Tax=Cladophialophora carrionii TaxID=86049 RepID=A0A1C1CZB3_9EURO|nr:maltose permease MAL31 [Cladophialophora carrionii]
MFTRDEKDMTIREGLKVYKGFDTNLLDNFYAYPSFQRKYGHFVGVSKQTPTGYSLPLPGKLVSVKARVALRPRKVLLYTLCVMTCFPFIVFFAPSREVLLVGQIPSGFEWGIFATTAPAYASEVLPLQLRVYFTSYTNMCFIIGQFFSAGLLCGLVHRVDQWGYRTPFAVQWVWPAFLIPLIFFAPEPYHLVRHNKLEEAKRSISKITGSWTGAGSQENASPNRLYRLLGGATQRGHNIFQQVGLSTDAAYSLAWGANGLAFLACLANWFLLMPFSLYRLDILAAAQSILWGMFFMATELCIIGILNPWTDRPSVAWTQAVLTLVWTATFQLSAGQLGWALPAEIGSTRLRQKTVCLARNVSNISGTIGGTLENYFMNPQAWNLQGYTGFVWGGCAWLVFIWAYFRLPETKDRTFHELEILFAKNVPVRQIKTTQVDAFDEHEQNQLAVRYSVSGQAPGNPSFIPSVTNVLASHGHAEDTLAQRRGSIASGQSGSRGPSIAFAVTEYLKTH